MSKDRNHAIHSSCPICSYLFSHPIDASYVATPYRVSITQGKNDFRYRSMRVHFLINSSSLKSSIETHKMPKLIEVVEEGPEDAKEKGSKKEKRI